MSGAGVRARRRASSSIAVESAVPNCRPLERPEAVGEDTDQVGSYRLNVPPGAQTRCCEGILVKGIQEIGDAAPLSGNGVEYLFANQTSPPILAICRFTAALANVLRLARNRDLVEGDGISRLCSVRRMHHGPSARPRPAHSALWANHFARVAPIRPG